MTTIDDATPLAAPQRHRQAILDLLAAVRQQHPGAWLPVNHIAGYLNPRASERAIWREINRLLRGDIVEGLPANFDGRKELLVRLSQDSVDLDVLEECINAVLERVGHRIAIRPGPAMISSFSPVSLRYEDRLICVYQQKRAYKATVTRAISATEEAAVQ